MTNLNQKNCYQKFISSLKYSIHLRSYSFFLSCSFKDEVYNYQIIAEPLSNLKLH